MSSTVELGKFGETQEELLDAIERARKSAQNGAAGPPMELILAMRAAAAVKLQNLSQQVPSWVEREELASFMDEMILRMSQTMDLTLEPKQIMKWIYLRFGTAIKDAKRETDLLTRRQREIVNLAQKQITVLETQLGRELTEAERREEVRKVLGPQQSKRRDVENFLTLIAIGLQRGGLEDAQSIEDGADPAADAIDAERKQALHIAGLDIFDDELFRAFSELANGSQVPPAPIKKKLEAHLQRQLLAWRTPDEIELRMKPPPELVDGPLGQQEFVFEDNRPLRYLHFVVDNWGLSHESRIEDMAEPRLGMSTVIARQDKHADVYAAEPPLEIWGVRRWRLLAALLRAPNLRDSDWPIYAAKIKNSLPYGVRMRVITQEIFEQQVQLAARDRAAEEARDEAAREAVLVKARVKAPTDDLGCTVFFAKPTEEWNNHSISASTMRVGNAEIALVRPARPHLRWDWRVDLKSNKHGLIVRKIEKSGKYVVAIGVDGPPLLRINANATKRLDSEFKDGSTRVLRAWKEFPRSGKHSGELKISLMPLQQPIKHGGGCRKRGCTCEVGMLAERERKRRSRE